MRAALGPALGCRHLPARRVLCRVAQPTASSKPTRGTVTAEDRIYISRALDLAKRALGKTKPNPAVGCVIVKDGKVVGEGYHPKAGMPHAEVYALRGAGNNAEGATAYVTLEPCNHFGRTPPCSRALVDAKVARVVVGVGDPNPLVASEGIATLERAGIQVAIMDGAESEACYEVNRDFMEGMALEAAQAAARKAAAAEVAAVKAEAAAKAEKKGKDAKAKH